jgi:hypothetical protein
MVNGNVKSRWVRIVLVAAIGWFGFAGMKAVEASDSATAGDMAKMYRVKHELTFDVKGKRATLDGKKWAGDLPIIRDGRAYVPLRVLRDSGVAASVTWDQTKRQATIVMNKKLMPSFEGLIFRIGSEKLNMLDGQELSGVAVPKPFLQGGRAYIPLKPLIYLGVSTSMSGGKLTMSWSDKIIELLKPAWETDRAEETFTMLFQKDMNAPIVYVASGDGAWSGATGKVTGRDIAMDGRLYNRMEFTLNLRLGGNPLSIYSSSTGMARFDIIRHAADDKEVPMKVTWDGQAYVKLSSPAGYVKVKAGEAIPVEGSLLKQDPNFKQVSLDIYKFVPGSRDGYQSLGGERTTIEIQDNGVFTGSFTLTEPGSYLVNLLSPPYIATPSGGLASTTWAEFVVDVVQ